MLLEVRQVEKRFSTPDGRLVRALNDMNLQVAQGQALGLVGESGCGKTTLGRLCARLAVPTQGQVLVEGREAGPRASYDPALTQFVFQDPHSALNPRLTIQRSVAEPLRLHTPLRSAALRERVATLLADVGLPAQFLDRYPHELSGGQKQRACIARAIALGPRLLVLDEPTSALDVSVQAQILSLLRELRQRLQMAYLFISHNLAVVRALCERVSVMYLGYIVEEGPAHEVFEQPLHPYTEALIDAIPVPEGVQPERRLRLGGEIPSAIDLPPGCPFASRCPKMIPGLCDTQIPALHEATPGRKVRCFLYSPLALSTMDAKAGTHGRAA